MTEGVVVFNPLAGRRAAPARLPAITEALAGVGCRVRHMPTKGPGDAARCANEAAAAGAEVVFAYGGDGTLRECAAGLLGTETALAFLPGGTMNVMALELGVPSNPIKAAAAYGRAERRRMDVGLANAEPFLMQASAGIDARLIGELRSREKKWLGRAASVPAALRSLAGYRFPRLEVTCNSATSKATLVVASNIARYGGPWKLCPLADSADGLLDLFLFSGRGRVAILRFALGLLAGRHGGHGSITRVQAREATVRSDENYPAQIDGDLLFANKQRLEVAVSPDPLHMLVPSVQTKD